MRQPHKMQDNFGPGKDDEFGETHGGQSGKAIPISVQVKMTGCECIEIMGVNSRGGDREIARDFIDMSIEDR